MGHPPVGMYYEDVRNKLLKYKTVETNPNMKASLLNQARIHEGEDAVAELQKEYSDRKGKYKAFAGSANRQTGIGDGVKGSHGHYEFIGGKLVRVGEPAKNI